MSVQPPTSEEQFPTIKRIMATTPPPHLFHYTSSDGLIKIVQKKELWATHARFFNDLKELGHALDYVDNAIHNRLTAPTYRDAYSGPEQNTFKLMNQYARALSPRVFNVFVASLTKNGDQLSQWRAYCPPTGGYAIGFPSRQLIAMAEAQDFYLTPCVYDHEPQYLIVSEIIDYHMNRFRAQIGCWRNLGQAAEDTARAFALDISRYGPMLKHHSFHEEKEWRLVSPQLMVGDARIAYRPGRNSIIPYLPFRVASAQHRNLVILADRDNSLGVIVGPTADSDASAAAVESFLRAELGVAAWHGISEIPYRGV